ncbi:MAG TPA: energy transducer TonB [Candidatus Acidoferrales bacterium]|nr:energy transducer TonB [Candidatus Acidoferrales bacterium]
MLKLLTPERPTRLTAVRQIETPAIPVRTPQFIVVRDSASSSLWESVKTLFARVKLPGYRNSGNLFRHVTLERSASPKRPFSASLVIHLCFILLIVYLHQAMPRESFAAPVSPYAERIYYRVPLVEQAKLLPRVAPAGPGGRPGAGSVPDRSPALGSSARQMVVIISKPVHPDNSHQTIYQPKSPPDIRITTDIKLPNIVSVQIPRPVFRFKPSETRPVQAERRLNTEVAPAVTAQNAAALKSLEESSDPQLRVPLLPAVASAPQARDGRFSSVQEAPPIEGATMGTGLVVISVDPGGPATPVALPPGNRSGDFAISGAPGNGGSPAGSPNGAIGGGAGGSHTGSDASTGLGVERAGGGGGRSGGAGALSINGSGGDPGGAGTLGPAVAMGMVYPVSRHLSLRKSSIVVSAGPVGGGGLDVYDVLRCGKIYTIFLAMPGKNWTMQYCQKPGTEAAKPAPPRSTSTFVHMDSGLVPPDLDVETRYDFRRLPVPPEKAHKLIVLKGILGADGTVGGLEVFQGILPQMDQAAKIAFSRWKFKPAMREGKPVPVEILVGVPVDATENVSN